MPEEGKEWILIRGNRSTQRKRSLSKQPDAPAASRRNRDGGPEYLAQRAHRELRALIMSGRYTPGDHLKEEELVKVLRVSRSIVRQVLLQLTAEGLLVDQPKRGKAVALYDDEQIGRLLPIRIALEQLAVREAIARLTDEDAAELARMAERLRDPGLSLAEQDAADIDVHRRIWTIAGNPELERLLNRIVGPFHLMASAVMVSPVYKRHWPAISWQLFLLEKENHAGGHQPLIQAICRRDAEAAESAVASHLAVDFAPPEDIGRRVGELMQRYWRAQGDPT